MSGGRSQLVVEDLVVHLQTPAGPAQAVDGVSLELGRGEFVGVVGESGSGKTMLARAIMQLLPRAAERGRVSGRVLLGGRDLMTLGERELCRIRGREIAMIFQNPMTSLNPVLTVADQMALVLRRHMHLRGADIRKRSVELLDMVAIPDPERHVRDYPSQLSGGMQQRVALAIALSGDPDVLIADEPTTALDVTVQAEILGLIERLRRERELSVLFVTHDMSIVASCADRVVVMYAGRILEDAATGSMFDAPRVPYTAGLLASSPRLDDPADAPMGFIPGRPPALVAPPAGCRFAPRCDAAGARCTVEAPPLIAMSSDHRYACWYPNELAAAS